MKEDVLFKRTPFGGFDRVEVISYIQQLKSTQQKYKLMLDEKDSAVLKLTREKEDLEIQVEEFKKINEQIEKELNEAKESLKILEEKIENGEVGEDEYASQTVKMCDDLVEAASETSKRLLNVADEKLAKAENAVNKVVAELESREKVTAKQAKDLLKKLQEELANGRV